MFDGQSPRQVIDLIQMEILAKNPHEYFASVDPLEVYMTSSRGLLSKEMKSFLPRDSLMIQCILDEKYDHPAVRERRWMRKGQILRSNDGHVFRRVLVARILLQT